MSLILLLTAAAIIPSVAFPEGTYLNDEFFYEHHASAFNSQMNVNLIAVLNKDEIGFHWKFDQKTLYRILKIIRIDDLGRFQFKPDHLRSMMTDIRDILNNLFFTFYRNLDLKVSIDSKSFMTVQIFTSTSSEYIFHAFLSLPMELPAIFKSDGWISDTLHFNMIENYAFQKSQLTIQVMLGTSGNLDLKYLEIDPETIRY
jgi:hypothetical protein